MSASIPHPKVVASSINNVEMGAQDSRGETNRGEGGKVIELCSGGGAGQWRHAEEALMAAVVVEDDTHSRDW